MIGTAMRSALAALSTAVVLAALPLTPVHAETSAVVGSQPPLAVSEPVDDGGDGSGDWGVAGLLGLVGLFGYKKYRATRTPAAPPTDDGLDDRGSGAHRI